MGKNKSSDTTDVFLGVLLFAFCAVLPVFFPQFVLFILVLGAIVLPFFMAKEPKKEYGVPDIHSAMTGLISVMMKADGQNTKQELDEVKAFLLKRFGEQKAKKMLLLLKDSLQKEIQNIRPHCLRFNRNFSYSQKLDFLTLLFRIAEANGEICQNEAEILSKIARHTAISNSDFIELTHQFSTFYNYQKRQIQTLVYHDTRWAYKTLLIEENASVEEIKKAYRKLAMQYHPDRIDSNDTMAQAQAAEKFRDINEAYKYLKKEKRR